MSDLSTDDAALMGRLFGPRIPAELAEMFEDAKGVEIGALEDVHVALDVLLSNIIHTGLGGGFAAGWRLDSEGDRFVLAVCRISPLAVAA